MKGNENKVQDFFDDLRIGNATLESIDEEVRTQISLTLHHRLQQLSIFNKPPPKFISELATLCVPKVYGKGDLIYSESDFGDTMFILYSGVIDVLVGGKNVSQIQKQGQTFGEKSLINTSTPRESTLIANQQVDLFYLKRDALDKVLEKYPKLKENFTNNEKSKENTAQNEEMSQKVEQRISQFYDIMRMQQKGGRNNQSTTFTKSLQQDFAYKLNHEIRKVDLFKTCSTQFISALAKNLIPRIFNEDETIFSEGEAGKEMYFITTGEVDIVKGGKVVFTMKSGNFFGEMALVDSIGIRNAGAKAKINVDLLVLNKKEFNEALNDFPNEKHAIERVIEDRKKKNEEVGVNVKNRITQMYKLFKEDSKSKSSSQLGVIRGTEIQQNLLEDVAFHLNTQLRKVPLFKDCSQEFISTLCKALKPIIFIPGTNVFLQGEIGHEMFFVVTGIVEVVVGGGKVVAELGDGAFFGEGALVMSDGKRNATIRAKTECDCFVLSKEDLEKVFEQFPEQKVNIISVTQARVSHTAIQSLIGSEIKSGEEITSKIKDILSQAIGDKNKEIFKLNTEITDLKEKMKKNTNLLEVQGAILTRNKRLARSNGLKLSATTPVKSKFNKTPVLKTKGGRSTKGKNDTIDKQDINQGLKVKGPKIDQPKSEIKSPVWKRVKDHFFKKEKKKVEENWEDPVYAAKMLHSRPNVATLTKICVQLRKANEEWMKMFVGDLGGFKILLDVYIQLEYGASDAFDFWENDAVKMLMIIYTLNAFTKNKFIFEMLLDQLDWEDILLILITSLDSTSGNLHEFSVKLFLRAMATDRTKGRELLEKALKQKQIKNKEPLKNKYEPFLLILELEDLIPSRIAVMTLFNTIIDDLKVLENRIKFREELLGLGFRELLEIIKKKGEDDPLFDELDDAIDKFETKMEADEDVVEDIISEVDSDLDDLGGLYLKIKSLTAGTMFYDQLVNIFKHMMLLANDSKLAVVGFPFLEKAVHKAIVLTSEKEIDDSINLAIKDIKKLVEEAKKNPPIIKLSQLQKEKDDLNKPPPVTPSVSNDGPPPPPGNNTQEVGGNAPPPPPPPPGFGGDDGGGFGGPPPPPPPPGFGGDDGGGFGGPPPPPPPPGFGGDDGGGFGGPPPPPPPPGFGGDFGGPPPPPPPGMDGFGGPPPPPPPGDFGGPPPPPGFGGPPPPPGFGGPPPPPGFGPKAVKGPNIPKPKTKMKPLYWTKLGPFQLKDTLWGKSAPSEIKIDTNQLEELFCARAAKTEDSSSKKEVVKKPTLVSLLDGKRANNVSIVLSQFKTLTYKQMVEAILNVDGSCYNIEQLEALLKYAPTSDEIQTIEGYTGDKNLLDKPEQFFVELLTIKRLNEKLTCFILKLEFDSKISALGSNVQIYGNAIKEIQESPKLKKVLDIILMIGNFLNHGTAKGNCQGFNLGTLKKLGDTKATTNPRMSIMHYIVEFVQKSEEYKDIYEWPEELSNVPLAVKLSLSIMRSETNDVSKRLNVVQKEVADCSKEKQAEKFHQVMSSFLGRAKVEVDDVLKVLEGVEGSIKSVVVLYGEPDNTEPSDFLTTFNEFIDAWENCKKDNEKREIAEKKQREKDEKLNQKKDDRKKKLEERAKTKKEKKGKKEDKKEEKKEEEKK